MSAVLKEDYLTYSPSQHRIDRARHAGIQSDSAPDEPQPKEVRNYLYPVDGFIGRISNERILVAQHRFRVGVEAVVMNNRVDGYLAVLQEDSSRVGGGENVKAALEDLQQLLVADYEFYMGKTDEQLTSDAQAYKRLLQSLLREL